MNKILKDDLLDNITKDNTNSITKNCLELQIIQTE